MSDDKKMTNICRCTACIGKRFSRESIEHWNPRTGEEIFFFKMCEIKEIILHIRIFPSNNYSSRFTNVYVLCQSPKQKCTSLGSVAQTREEHHQAQDWVIYANDSKNWRLVCFSSVLSYGGELQMGNSVSSSMSTFHISTFLRPKEIIEQIDK